MRNEALVLALGNFYLSELRGLCAHSQAAFTVQRLSHRSSKQVRILGVFPLRTAFSPSSEDAAVLRFLHS